MQKFKFYLNDKTDDIIEAENLIEASRKFEENRPQAVPMVIGIKLIRRIRTIKHKG